LTDNETDAHPWSGGPRATVDIFEKLDRQTQEQVLACAEKNCVALGDNLTEKNNTIYKILDHLGKLGIVLHFLVNSGFCPAALASEFGLDISVIKEAAQQLGVSKCFRSRKTNEVFSMSRLLGDMNVAYEANRRVTYDYKGIRYSAFPSFYLPEVNVMIFIKNSGHTEKTGRQDAGLRARGYRILRFTPKEVRHELVRVGFDIEAAIQSTMIGKTGAPYVLAVPMARNDNIE